MSDAFQKARLARARGPVGARLALCTCMVLLAGVGLQACGGGSVSESVPKSTPNIVPPHDTSAEKAALSTTSTSTTSTKSTSTTGEPSSSGGESSKSESSESSSSGGTSEAGSSGGASPGGQEKAAPQESAKGTETPAGGATGGASAP